MATIKTSYILMALIAAPIAFSRNDIQAQGEQRAPIAEYRQEQRDDRAESNAKAREALKDSSIALTRVQGLCTPVKDKATSMDRELAEGGPAEAENGVALAEGSKICTAGGSTAEVRNGVSVDVRNIALEDKAEYQQFFKQQDQTRILN